jgi:hypothetical protein
MLSRSRQRQQDERQAWESAAASAPPFSPRDLAGKVTAWLRLAASAQASGEWTDHVDVLNSNPASINSARRPAVGASANGLPVATYITNDCVSWPIAASNYSTTEYGVAFWMNVDAFGTISIFEIGTGTAGAAVRSFELELVSSQRMKFNVFDAASGAKTWQTAASAFPAAGTWTWVRTHYSSIGATDTDKGKFYVNGVQLGSLSITGASTGIMRSNAGNILLGNYNNGAALQAYAGKLGPNLFILNSDLTAAEETALMNFERPT